MACSFLLPSIQGDDSRATEYQNIVERALNALHNDYKQSWSFTETSTSEDGTNVAHFNPLESESKRWTLVSVNDRPPTAKEQKAFQAEKLKRHEKVKKRDAKIGRRATVKIRPGTLKLRTETETHWTFDFVPAEEGDDDKIMQHLNGMLRISKEGPYVESVTLKNQATIKPVMGVSINTILVQQDFEPAGPAGPIVPVNVDVQIKGRAFLLMKLNESEKVRFSHYKYVGD